jgi:hypothetical protein
MKLKLLICGVIFLGLALTTALAGDVSGKWTAEYQSPNGQNRQSTFDFQVKGEKLTGTVASARGESAIEEGKVKGDDISFTVVRNFGGNDLKFAYKGKLAGDEIKFTVTVGDGERTFEMTAKRVK